MKCPPNHQPRSSIGSGRCASKGGARGGKPMSVARPVVVLVLALISWVTPTTLFAQATGAEILGVVKDESGGVLPGVGVTVTNVDTGVTRSLVTAEDGRYRAPDLPVGNYEVQGELQGFRTAIRRGIQLTVG